MNDSKCSTEPAPIAQPEHDTSRVPPAKEGEDFWTKDPNPTTEFWTRETTPEEAEKSPGLDAVRGLLAEELIDHAKVSDRRATARKLFQQSITNQKNAQLPRTRDAFTTLLKRVCDSHHGAELGVKDIVLALREHDSDEILRPRPNAPQLYGQQDRLRCYWDHEARLVWWFNTKTGEEEHIGYDALKSRLDRLR